MDSFIHVQYYYLRIQQASLAVDSPAPPLRRFDQEGTGLDGAFAVLLSRCVRPRPSEHLRKPEKWQRGGWMVMAATVPECVWAEVALQVG